MIDRWIEEFIAFANVFSMKMQYLKLLSGHHLMP